MQKLKAFVCSHYIIMLICLFLLLGIVIPLCNVQTFLGHDVYFHMTRMEALAQEIEAGNIPARIYYFIYDGYGYASPMFYGDLFLVIPALLILCGVSMPLAYKTFMILCVCACVIVSYLCGKRMFGSKGGGLCFAFTYAVSSYFAVDVFTRAAVGEMQAFIFVPVAFCGLHSILCRDGKQWYLLPLGLSAVLFSHLITSVMTVVFLLFFALIHSAKIFKAPKKLGAIALCALVFVLVSASFLFPLLEQLSSTEFLATDGYSATVFGTMEQRAMTLRQLFSLFNLNESHEHWIPNGIGYLPLVLVVFRIFVLKKAKWCMGDTFLTASTLSLFAVCTLFPWEKPFFQNLFSTIQFPWRIMLFATLFLGFAAAEYYKVIKKEDKRIFVATVCVLGIVAFSSVYIPRYNLYAGYEKNGQVVNYYKDNNIGYNIGTGEYLPSGTKRVPLQNHALTQALAIKESGMPESTGVVVSDGSIRYCTREKDGSVWFDIPSGHGCTYAELPLINYKGYTAVFTDTQGNVIPLSIEYGKHNVVRLSLEGISSEGRIFVTYSGTGIQKVSFVTSVLSVLLLGGYIVYACIKGKKAQPSPYCDCESCSSVPNS